MFRQISGCSAEQKTLGFPFRTIPQRRKYARNFVPWNKNRSKLSQFRSEPFRERENISEFGSVEQKKKQTLGILFPTIPRNTATKGNAFFLLPARMSVIKLILARNGILLLGRNNYLTPARHSPRIFVNLLVYLSSSPEVSKIFPFLSSDSSKIFGNVFMYMFPARNYP